MKEYSSTDSLVALILQDSLPVTNSSLNAESAETLADVLARLPAPSRETLWRILDVDQHAAIMPLLQPCVRETVLSVISTDELSSFAPMMETRTTAAVVDQLDPERVAGVIECLNNAETDAVNTRLASATDSVLRWMRDDTATVRSDWTLEQVSTFVRENFTALPYYTSTLLVTDQDNRYLGKLALVSLTISPPEIRVQDVMDTNTEVIHDTASEYEIANVFEDRRLIQVAVVDSGHRLLGRVTVDEAIKLIKKRSDDQFMKTAGLEHNTDLFATPFTSFKSRGIWLAINLVTVFLAAGVISFFQHTVQQVVALAVLMPIVSSMGGIAGSQTLTLTIRGLSMGQLGQGNVGWLFKKETWVGVWHGMTWSVVVGLVTYFWFGSPMLALSIAVALFLNLLAAAIVGVIIPMVLDRVGADPALSGSVVLTTVTDIVGFTLFLGLATWWLL